MTVDKINTGDALRDAEKLLKTSQASAADLRALLMVMIILVKALLSKLGVDSKNSSKPPSQDPRRKRGSKKKSDGKKRKPGGQNGHEGTTLNKVENPDIVTPIKLDRRTLPRGQYKVVGVETRQVIDIEFKKIVTEFQAEVLEDQNGKRFVAPFPDGVTRPAQYGDSVKAQAVYLSQQQLIPYERTQDFFSDQCGIPISPGTLYNFNSEAYEALELFELILKKQLHAQPVLHVDETGINVNGKLHWLHTTSNDLWTLFYPHAKRGSAAMDEIAILENFSGILCHDHWKPYFRFNCHHALCNAHHLRELERVVENDRHRWASDMQDLLRKMNKASTDSGGSLGARRIKAFIARYRKILAKGERECPPPCDRSEAGKRGRIPKSKARNLLERLRDYETETLRFLNDNRVPFTNNLSENDIRMTKVQQKISGCFRSMDGAHIFCRIRSYLSTCRKHGLAPTEALKTLFAGKLPEFIKLP